MKIGVTGASGFIGGHALDRLKGHEVVALARDPSKLGVTARELDLQKPIDPSALEGLDAIVHLAALLPTSYADPAQARACLEANALGTLELAQAAVSANVRALVMTSSGNAYAWADRPVKEADLLYPSARATFYLTSKLAAEIFADHVGKTSALRVVVLRPSAVYGPRMTGGLVPTLARKLKAREKVTLHDGGAYAVDLVHVRDVVESVARALEKDIRGAINIGSGVGRTTLDVARVLSEVLGAPEGAIELVPPGPRGPDKGFATLDIARMREELGVSPTSLEDGLRDYVGSL